MAFSAFGNVKLARDARAMHELLRHCYAAAIAIACAPAILKMIKGHRLRTLQGFFMKNQASCGIRIEQFAMHVMACAGRISWSQKVSVI